MTDEEFAEFCAEHPDLFFEMTSEGEIIVMPPTYTLTGVRNLSIESQRYNMGPTRRPRDRYKLVDRFRIPGPPFRRRRLAPPS